jgi:hypothetical protein
MRLARHHEAGDGIAGLQADDRKLQASDNMIETTKNAKTATRMRRFSCLHRRTGIAVVHWLGVLTSLYVAL